MTEFKPKISVITTFFNSADFIDHFLLDCQRQTSFNDCEFLFIDDCSKQNEREAILKLKDKYPNNISYIKTDVNMGLYECWNLGIKIARADILTNWNTDDRRFPDSLERQFRGFLFSAVDVTYGQTLTTFEKNEFPEDCQSKSGQDCIQINCINDLMKVNSPHCLPMWRKSVHDRFGYFDSSYKICADYEMWLRAAKNGARFLKIDGLTGTYYRNPSGISSSSDGVRRGLAEIEQIRAKYK